MESQYPTWYITIKPYFEIAYFISGLIVAMFAPFVYFQFRTLKKESTIRSKREATTLAVKLCEQFTKLLDTEIDEYRGKIFKVVGFGKKWDLLNKEFNKDSFRNKEEAENWFNKATKNGEGDLLRLCNLIDRHSFYFLYGIADENIGFQLIGRNYCSLIREIAPYLAFESKMVENEIDKNAFMHLIKLFQIWDEKIEKEFINEELKSIETKAQSLKNKAVSIKAKSIPPIGSEN